MSLDWDVVVIGGGAAGFFAALTTKAQKPALRVVILEASRQVLAKVRISGGGRCNVTHECDDPRRLLTHYPRGHKKLLENFRQFGPPETRRWFESRGVPLKTESDGRVFPQSDDSESIISCLLNEAHSLGVVIQTGTPVQDLERLANGTFQLQTSAGNLYTSTVVIATGSASLGVRLAKSLGHTMIDGVPSLFTFCVNDPDLTALAGVSVPHVRGRLKMEAHDPITQDGPLLITHWGLSGPCILKLSAWGARALAASNYHATLLLDWLPEVSSEALRSAFAQAKAHHPQKQLKNLDLNEIAPLPQRLWMVLLEKSGLTPDRILSEVKDKALNALAERLKQWPVTLEGKGVFKEEFVTAGGVALADIDLKTYESRVCPGAFIVGELLNIDGVTGGFNFQNAWTGGYLAGKAIAQFSEC